MDADERRDRQYVDPLGVGPSVVEELNSRRDVLAVMPKTMRMIRQPLGVCRTLVGSFLPNLAGLEIHELSERSALEARGYEFVES